MKLVMPRDLVAVERPSGLQAAPPSVAALIKAEGLSLHGEYTIDSRRVVVDIMALPSGEPVWRRTDFGPGGRVSYHMLPESLLARPDSPKEGR